MPGKIEDRSLWIFSEKHFANDRGEESKVKVEGNEGLTILCNNLLILVHNFVGKDLSDGLRWEELYSLLAMTIEYFCDSYQQIQTNSNTEQIEIKTRFCQADG